MPHCQHPDLHDVSVAVATWSIIEVLLDFYHLLVEKRDLTSFVFVHCFTDVKSLCVIMAVKILEFVLVLIILHLFILNNSICDVLK